MFVLLEGTMFELYVGYACVDFVANAIMSGIAECSLEKPSQLVCKYVMPLTADRTDISE